MQIEIVDNLSSDMASRLARELETAEDIKIAVAFVSKSGLAIIESHLEGALRKKAFIEFLVGLDMRSTDPDALQSLYILSRENDNLGLYCFASLDTEAIYHPKVYLFRKGDAVTSIIGSSNLTEGGLKRNLEINIAMRGTLQEEALSDVYSAYNQLKFHPKRVIPDEEFLRLYGELCRREKSNRRVLMREKNSAELLTRFRNKAKSLRRPTATRRDLVGWLELVYDSLPEGEFTNEDVYRKEPIFRKAYPENRNIEAKIRQKLQDLRDMGFVEHLGTARWRKV